MVGFIKDNYVKEKLFESGAWVVCRVNKLKSFAFDFSCCKVWGTDHLSQPSSTEAAVRCKGLRVQPQQRQVQPVRPTCSQDLISTILYMCDLNPAYPGERFLFQSISLQNHRVLHAHHATNITRLLTFQHFHTEKKRISILVSFIRHSHVFILPYL